MKATKMYFSRRINSGSPRQQNINVKKKLVIMFYKENLKCKEVNVKKATHYTIPSP